MKRLILSIVFCIIAFPLAAQETLISGDLQSGGFGGPVVKLSSVRGENAILVGGRGGWVVNKSFVIGGGGYGLVTNHDARTSINGITPRIRFGYGGLELEYINDADKLVHYGGMLLIGGGGVSLDTVKNGSWDNNHDQMMNDEVFVIEPSVNVELNVTDFFRVMFSGSYRFISGVTISGAKNSDLTCPSAVLTLKFGVY